MKLNVYGRIKIEILRENDEWVVYVLGEGKKRPVNDIVIPSDVKETELITFIEDLFHESATPTNKDIKIID